MFDVFYTGPKPNLFAFERPAKNLVEAQSLARTEYLWFIDGHNDYSDFNFNWKPAPWEAEFTHAWPSQWQQNGGTLFCYKNVVEHKWHWQDVEVMRQQSAPIYYIDFYNQESQKQFLELEKKYQVKSVRYVGTHLDVFRRIVNSATTDYIWIVSSICDYSRFDFTWHPSQWQLEMVHCFPNGPYTNTIRGDTFYIHVESFKQQMFELELLDWFNVINYINDGQVPERWPIPAHHYTGDDLVGEIKKYNFNSPLVLFTNQPSIGGLTGFNNCIWDKKDRVIESFSSSNAICVVPRDAKTYIDSQIYDYPYINTESVQNVYTEESLDIIYISNGEPEAEYWFQHLCNQLEIEHSGYPSLVYDNRIKRVKDVDGRAAAYQAAARLSETPWFFAVFAKLEVAEGFNWNWQPDYWQGPKHYIFNARNPVNGLEYGHMGMIAYNKRLVLETDNPGLDFTLSQPHEVVPELSGIAHYDQDPWTTWRTAFREVLKLFYYKDNNYTLETEHRLEVWLNKANGPFAEWSLSGAKDARDYYIECNGNYDAIKKSFEWNWLQDKFKNLYKSF